MRLRFLITIVGFGCAMGCAKKAPPGASPVVDEVTITDSKIERCLQIYQYLEIAQMYGHMRVTINGHLWEFSNPMSVVEVTEEAAISLLEIGSREELAQRIREHPNSFAFLDLDRNVPAEKLFMSLDVLNDLDVPYWINRTAGTEDNGRNDMRLVK